MFKKVPVLSMLLLTINPLSANVYSDYLFAKFGEKVVEEKKIENPLEQKFTIFKPEFFDVQAQNISERDAYEIAFTTNSEKNESDTLSVIDQSLINKMEIVIGDENKQASLLLKHFDAHLSTAFGAKQTIKMLSNPTDKIQDIQNRQAIITELIKNEKLFNELDYAIKQLGSVEKQLLAFFDSTPVVNPHVLNMLYPNIPGTKWMKSNRIAMEFLENQSFIQLGLMGTLGFATIIKLKMNNEKISALAATKALGAFIGNGIFYIVKETPSAACQLARFIKENAGFKHYVGGAYGAFIATIMIAAVPKMLKTQNAAKKHIQQLLIDTATYTTTSEQIGLIVRNNKILSSISGLHNITNFGSIDSTSKQLQGILSELNTNTFKGKPSYFSFTGRVLATYTKVQETKDELIPLMEAIGTLDMYLATAKLYKEHQNKQNGFCFAEFVENNTPVLEAKGFWNPFIDADVVVSNDARLDNDVPNIILTGPNECGKSTILKGLTFNVLLAQTFGIAPAKSLRLTAFSKINCYLNITDDTSAGKSLFRAQVEMSKKLIEELRNMPAGKFTFTIMDELFTGTSAHEGEQAAYIYAEKLMAFDNSITVLATHFDKLKKLEKASKGKYINFQVEAIREENNTITRTFKMKPGFSTMNIAFDILTEAGVI